MKEFLQNRENRVLLYVTLVTALYPIFMTYKKLMSIFSVNSFYGVILHYFSVFIFFFVVPIFILKLYKEKPGDYGLNFNNFFSGIKIILIFLPIVFVLIWISSYQKDFQVEYPLTKSIICSFKGFVIIESIYLLYYIGWEFLFRGFLLFGLAKKFGIWIAIMIETIPSTILHYNKPPGEIILAVIGGFILGYYALKYKTIFFAVIIHWAAGLMMDGFVILHLK